MNKTKFRIGIFIIALLGIVAILAYNYIYKSHRNIEEESPSYVISASDLMSEFSKDIENSSIKYLDKTIQVSGIVSSIDKTSLVIENKINCYFNDTIINYKQLLDKNIIVKGRCIGFDELLEEIKIDQCTIVNK